MYRNGYEIKPGADLTGVNMTDADLSCVNLTKANLTGAILRNADLTYADLARVDMTGAILSYAILTKADLTGAILRNAILNTAILRKANLTDANLTNAVLTNSSLSKANLTRANLTKANLTNTGLRDTVLTDAILDGTCINPELLKLNRAFCRECPPNRKGGRIVYRTSKSQHVGETEYVPGKTYVAPVLSFAVETECHPGIYAGSLSWMQENFPKSQIVRGYVRDGEWVLASDGSIRCKRIRILSYQ